MLVLIECCWFTSARFLLKKSIHGRKSNFTPCSNAKSRMCHSNLAYDGKTTSINSVIQKINKSRCQGGSEALQNSVTPHVIVLFSFCTPSCSTNWAGCKGHRFIPTLLLIVAASMILQPCHFAYHSSPNGAYDHHKNETPKLIRAAI